MTSDHGSTRDCERAREWASLRLDAQASEFELVLLDGHLARCADCRAFADSVDGLTEILRSAPLEEARVSLPLPRRARARLGGVRAASVAAVVAVSLGCAAVLQLSTGGTLTTASRADWKLIGFKERQLESAGVNVDRPVRPGLAAAEGVDVGAVAGIAARPGSGSIWRGSGPLGSAHSGEVGAW